MEEWEDIGTKRKKKRESNKEDKKNQNKVKKKEAELISNFCEAGKNQGNQIKLFLFYVF